MLSARRACCFLTILTLSSIAHAQTVGGKPIEQLIAELDDGLPVSRAMAAMNLAMCGERCSAAYSAVREKFNQGTDETMVHVALAHAIVRIDPYGDVSDVVNYLINVVDGGLNGNEDRSMERAIEALGAAGPRAASAIPILQQAQQHWAGSVKSKAFSALQRIQGR